MDRCKLEYLIRKFSSADKEEIIQLFDPEGRNYFHSLARDFLMNPDTKDVYTLSFIPANYKIENIENTKILYRQIFKRMNELFIANKTCPVFDNPADLTACELTRRDMLLKRSEKQLNEFFGVESFYDYVPPVYEL